MSDYINEQVMKNYADELFKYYNEHIFEIESDALCAFDEFIKQNRKIWGQCFALSQIMYRIVVDAIEDYNDNIKKYVTEEDKKRFKYRYNALQNIHGRACQEYLEILTLMRAGFADGAFSRWRSMDELVCVAYVIKSQNDTIAKQFCEKTGFEEKDYSWTEGCVDKNGNPKSLKSLIDIRDYCELGDYYDLYKASCKFLHGTPQGTFYKLSIPDGFDKVLLGNSLFGIKLPGIAAANSLFLITCIFFDLFSNDQSRATMIVLDHFFELLINKYDEVNKELIGYKNEKSR